MPRSRINGNFIDKTFSIVANILLRIIPTTSGEKESFTYYRDGAIWFFLFAAFNEKDTLFGIERIERKQIWNKSTLFVKVKFVNKTIPSVMYPQLMQP